MGTERTAASRFLVLLGLALGLLSLTGCWHKKVVLQTRTGDDTLPLAPLAETVEPSSEKIKAALDSSVHSKVDCTGCHIPEAKRTRPGDLGEGQCVSCHDKEAKVFADSAHAKLKTDGKPAATCTDCHGIHQVRAIKDTSSLVAVRNAPRTCGKCHENPEVAEKLGIKKPLAAGQYIESIHGKALLAEGLVVAPSCLNCHGKGHEILQASDARSTVNRARVAETCGACHVGERERYGNSVHGNALRDELAGKPPGERPNVAADKKPPTCPTCHSAHQIIERSPRFRLASDRICGDCHQDRLEKYLDTYHGRALDLGDSEVAACYSCHGAHDVWPSSNPASKMSQQNRLKTCQSCHPAATQNFAGYYAHADHSDRAHYPILYWAYLSMSSLLLGTFGFFGIHSVMWLGRSLAHKWRHPKAFREEKQRARNEEGVRLYQRFRPVDRFVHALVIVSFTLLVMTGMPLKFHRTWWAHAFFDAIGGAAVARATHRLAAIVTLAYFVIHLLSLRTLLKKRRGDYIDEEGRFRLRRFLGLAFGPDSPFPRWQDAKDVVAHMKYFVGLGPRPAFDRFTYWEKFDYMAVFWGVTMIGMSGLVMWLPELFTWVLPGWAINLSLVIHSDEALLAAGFIFTFHFFNTHFRPEKFPFDSVMFSGHQTEEELKQERPALYERMAKEGELEHFAKANTWLPWASIVKPFGAVAIALGLGLAALIYWSLLR